MFILYFALWVILNGKWTTEIALFGVVFAAVVYAFSCKFIGYSLSVDLALMKRVPTAIRYGMLLLSEIVKANKTVISMILNREFEPDPQLVQFDTALARERHRVVLANSITLTPGTITVDLDKNRYVVHCLDKSMVDGLDDGDMVKALERMEKLHSPADAQQAAAPVKAEAENDAQTETAAPAEEAAAEEAAAEGTTEEPAKEQAEQTGEEEANKNGD